MADIFISYSSKDREKAEQLTELLISAGLSVWIDKTGIDVATAWSGEIVDAIEGCKAFVVLLSPNSVASVNVVKEVSLAAEQKKKILPLDLEPVELSRDLKYHLAGLQRSPMTNIDAIIRSLDKFGIAATSAPVAPHIIKETDSRKSLIILPFEDLSPTQDNGWFADGLAGELIDGLANIKSLRILDRTTSLGLRGVRQTMVEIGRLFNTRYFVEGSVRKFGDQIKISVSLLDIETGDHLWQHSHKGVMQDIFELQETVAEKVIEGLKLHLTTEEKSKVDDWGTDNAEAYELMLKAGEYFQRQTKEGCRLTSELLTEAIRLDPNYAYAYLFKAMALSDIYRKYDRDPQLLVDAEALCMRSLELKPGRYAAYYPLSQIYMHQGNIEKAEETAKEFIKNDPTNSSSHFSLAFLYANIGQTAKSIPYYEAAHKLAPDSFSTVINLALASETIGDTEHCAMWAQKVLPYLERHLKLHPDDQHRRVHHAIMLHYSGRTEEAKAEAQLLTDLTDGVTIYNVACLFSLLGDNKKSIQMLIRSIHAGFKVINEVRSFIDDPAVADERGTPEYEEATKLVEQLEADAKKTNG